MNTALSTWTTLPHLKLGEFPTPFQLFPRFSEELKAEISNAARATAAAAAQSGFQCLLVLGGSRPEHPAGNLLLDELFGAYLYFAGETEWSQLAHELQTNDTKTSEGFVAAYHELLEQIDQHKLTARRIYHASTSGGTHAGLVLGHAIAARGPQIYGIGAAAVYDDMSATYAKIAQEAAILLGLNASITTQEISLDMSHLGTGYGEPTPEALDAIALLARTEGILCDPVYTG